MTTDNKYYKAIAEKLTGETISGVHTNNYYLNKICTSLGYTYSGVTCNGTYIKDFARHFTEQTYTKIHFNNYFLKKLAEHLTGETYGNHDDNYFLGLINENIIPQPPSFTSVEVTSDKSILSYADSESAVLTAQLMNGDVSASVSGETVDFYKYVDGTNDVLLGSDVTDSNGEASYSYASTGVGDVGLYAKVRSLVSETYSVQDCMFYDASSSVNLSKYSAQSGASFSYDSNNNAYNASPSTAGPRFVNLNNLTFSKDNAVSMDFNMVSTNNNAQIGFIIGNVGIRAIHAGTIQRITISNSAYSSDYAYKDNTINLNTWYTIELLTTGVLNLKQGDTIIATCNYDISSLLTDNNSFKIYTGYTIPTTNNVRNIKVKPL